MPRWFVCYSCGARIVVHESVTQATCPHCGLENTVPEDAVPVEQRHAAVPAALSPQPPPQKVASRQGRGIVIGVLGVIVVLAIVLSQSNDSGSGGDVPDPGIGDFTGTTFATTDAVKVTVFMEVDGPDRASITYTDANGSIQQDTNAVLPWTKSFQADAGEFVQLSAQNSAGGTLTCEVDVGSEPHTGTAHGQFAICSADAST